LRALPKAAFAALLELAKQRADRVAAAPDPPGVDALHADAVTFIVHAFGDLFPGLRTP